MIRHWILAARSKTLWAGICPVFLGTVLAFFFESLHWPSALFALAGALSIQIGTNFANDYFDFKKGADTANRQGPARMTQQGLISPEAMRLGFIVCFGLAFLFGLYLVFRGGWVILAVGVLSILFGIIYTGGPYPLAYIGFGDLFAFVFFGPVAVMCTYYVQALSWRIESFWVGCALGCFSVALITVNNLRDINEDVVAKKRTLAVRFGAVFAKYEYLVAVFLALLMPVGLVVWYGMPMGVLVAMFTVSVAVRPIKMVFSGDKSELNEVLAQTARLMLIYSMLFTLGLLLPLVG